MYTLSRRKKKLLKYGAVLLLVLLLLAVAVFFLYKWDKQQGAFSDDDTAKGLDDTVSYQGKDYILNENIETILVMGLDKFSYDVDNSSYTNNQQADFVMLLVIDDENKTCSAIHINRDTMTDINVLGVAGQTIDTVKGQLTLSYAYGNGKKVSCRNTMDSVSKILYDLDIDHYISLTMDSVPVFNDLVGGVEVTVMDDFSGIDETLVKGETVTLLGEHSLNYVRSRYNLEDSTNGRRMERQRQYLKALYTKAVSCIEQDDNFVVDASLKMSDYMVSDCSVTRLQELMRKVSDYEFTEIYSLEGETKMGEEYIEFYPDEEAVKERVINTFYKIKN